MKYCRSRWRSHSRWNIEPACNSGERTLCNLPIYSDAWQLYHGIGRSIKVYSYKYIRRWYGVFHFIRVLRYYARVRMKGKRNGWQCEERYEQRSRRTVKIERTALKSSGTVSIERLYTAWTFILYIASTATSLLFFWFLSIPWHFLVVHFDSLAISLRSSNSGFSLSRTVYPYVTWGELFHPDHLHRAISNNMLIALPGVWNSRTSSRENRSYLDVILSFRNRIAVLLWVES